MYYVDEHIKNTNRVFPQQGRYDYLRYDMNENPEGLPKKFVDSVLKEITPEFLSIYPEPDRFLNKYAAYIGASYENVVAVNGSDMGIRYLLETFGEKGKDVVTVAPSFEMYWVNCSILGLHHVPVAYEPDMTISIDKILDAITENTRIVVLLNPNNPIGNVYTEDELEKVIEENVVLLRTFSKLFSIAACRLGVVISNPQIIHYVKNAKLTFDANAIALLFAERILDHPEMIEQLIETEKEGKAYTLTELTKHGYETRDCRGNFIFVTPKHQATEVAQKLETEKKILVKSYGNEMLKKYLRISVGSKDAMERFLTAFFEIDERA